MRRVPGCVQLRFFACAVGRGLTILLDLIIIKKKKTLYPGLYTIVFNYERGNDEIGESDEWSFVCYVVVIVAVDFMVCVDVKGWGEISFAKEMRRLVRGNNTSTLNSCDSELRECFFIEALCMVVVVV